LINLKVKTIAVRLKFKIIAYTFIKLTAYPPSGELVPNPFGRVKGEE
jgi:hypothetical protein